MNTLETYLKNCRSCLMSSQEAQAYLDGRGISGSLRITWGLGYDPNSRRVVLPVCDYQGQPISFTARAIDPGADPKYLHQFGFAKSRWLFGLSQPVCGVPVVVEGPLDCISLFGMGISAYALQGSDMSLWQAAHFVWLSSNDEVLLYPDNGSGLEKQWSEQLRRVGLSVTIPTLPYSPFHPSSADPDWLARNDAAWLCDQIEPVFGVRKGE